MKTTSFKIKPSGLKVAGVAVLGLTVLAGFAVPTVASMVSGGHSVNAAAATVKTDDYNYLVDMYTKIQEKRGDNSKGIYDAKTYGPFEKAMNDAKALIDKYADDPEKIVDSNDYINVGNALIEADKKLIHSADFWRPQLDTTLVNAAKIAAQQSWYDATWFKDTFQVAYDNAAKVQKDSNADRSTLKKATEALQRAISDAEAHPATNESKEALAAAHKLGDLMRKINAANIVASDYTADSYATFKSAYDAAKKLDDLITYDPSVNNAAAYNVAFDALQKAYDGLVKVPGNTNTSTADKSVTAPTSKTSPKVTAPNTGAEL